MKFAAGSFNHHGMRYSTTVPNYPDTHEDFMPTNKLQNPDLSLKDIVAQDVNDNPMMIYMKKVPDLPRCGFGSLAVRVLKEYIVRDDHVVGLSCLRRVQEDETMEALKEEQTGANFVAGILFNVPLSARNILEDPELKNVVKSFSDLRETQSFPTSFPCMWPSGTHLGKEVWNLGLDLDLGFVSTPTFEELSDNWPTFPQIFIKGEFVRRSDIILNMHQTGELKEMLKDIAANQEN
ncbi:unnamed protein product [Camellia sinensis]